MMLEVGEHYLNAKSQIISISKYTWDEFYADERGREYYKNGSFFEDKEDTRDLIAHIPKQLLNHLVVEVKNYHTDNEFKQIIDNVYGETK